MGSEVRNPIFNSELYSESFGGACCRCSRPRKAQRAGAVRCRSPQRKNLCVTPNLSPQHLAGCACRYSRLWRARQAAAVRRRSAHINLCVALSLTHNAWRGVPAGASGHGGRGGQQQCAAGQHTKPTCDPKP